jgi:dTDP-6-deoxy-L-talose 4-dehydrogenase (NAD+)
MRVLITGATGFIGRYLVRYLSSIPDIDSALCIHNTNTPNKLLGRTIFFDIHNSTSVQKINGADYDYLIHLAWGNLDNYHSFHHLEEYYHQWMFLKKLVLDGLPGMTVLGTCFEYGFQYGSLHEELPANPVLAYAIAKDTLRRSLELLRRERSFDFKWLRLFYVQGKGQRKSLFGQLDTALAQGAEVFPLSGGEQLRDYLSINVVVEKIVAISFQKEIQGIINCCSGQPVSIRKRVEQYLADQGNPSIQLKWGALPYAKYEPMAFWGSRVKMDSALRNSIFQSNA